MSALPDVLSRGLQYFSLPFLFPQHALRLSWLTLSNRRLVGELARLWPQRKWFEATDAKTVIDVGSYIGAFAYAINVLIPEAQIYCFEPLPENYEQLRHNLSHVQRLRAFRAALGNQQGEVDFWRSDFSASSSVLPMGELHKRAFPHTAESTRISVPMARLDDYLPEMNLVHPVLLKLDVQGYEAQTLDGGEELLEQVDYLLTEVSYQPLYEGQVLFDQMYSWLKEKGFEYGGNFETLISPLDGTILQADALFVRRRGEESV